jgi:hypothetical protein
VKKTRVTASQYATSCLLKEIYEISINAEKEGLPVSDYWDRFMHIASQEYRIILPAIESPVYLKEHHTCHKENAWYYPDNRYITMNKGLFCNRMRN